MAITSVTGSGNRIDHNPDGIETVFTYDFEVADSDWLVVYADGVLYEEPFTLSGVGEEVGGEVTFTTAPLGSISTLTLIRVVPLTQEVVYPVLGPFPPKSHEGALDKLTWITQQLDEAVGRCLTSSVDNPGDWTLPSPVADKVLLWDATGAFLTNGPGPTDFATYVSDAEDARDESAASAATSTAAYESTLVIKQEVIDEGDTQVAVVIAEGDTQEARLEAIDTDTTFVRQDSPTGAAILPPGTTAQRPATPTNGMIRYNTDEETFEGYNGVEWGSIGGGGTPEPVIKTSDFTIADGSLNYLCDVSLAPITATLPASPEVGDLAFIGDYEGSCSVTNSIYLTSTDLIHGYTEDFRITASNSCLVLQYIDAIIGWKIVDGIGEQNGETTEADVKAVMNASGDAPVYACRAWVNFDGTGTVAIRASGNVSSITDKGTGSYTVNLITAMEDVNGCVSLSGGRYSDGNLNPVQGPNGYFTSTSTITIVCGSNDTARSDCADVCVSIFR